MAAVETQLERDVVAEILQREAREADVGSAVFERHADLEHG
jgi:hypothetical protein